MNQKDKIVDFQKQAEINVVLSRMGYEIERKNKDPIYTFWSDDWSKSVQLICIPNEKLIGKIKNKMTRYLGKDFILNGN